MDNINIDKTTGSVTEASVPASKYNLEYALEQIERIAIDTAHITEAFDTLTDVKALGSGDNSVEAIVDIVKCRETTNQKLIDFYSKMVDDLKPQKEFDEKEMFLKYVADAEGKRRPGTGSPNYAELWQAIGKK